MAATKQLIRKVLQQHRYPLHQKSMLSKELPTDVASATAVHPAAILNKTILEWETEYQRTMLKPYELFSGLDARQN